MIMRKTKTMAEIKTPGPLLKKAWMLTGFAIHPIG